MLPLIGSAEHAAMITHGRHPGVVSALAWLAFSHLPEELQSISEPIYLAAVAEIERIPTDTPELTSGLNYLVDAKDWMMRAGIRNDYGRPGPVARPDKVVDPPTDWAQTARDLTSGDPDKLAEHLPMFPAAFRAATHDDPALAAVRRMMDNVADQVAATGRTVTRDDAGITVEPSVTDNRIGPNFGRPIQDRPQA